MAAITTSEVLAKFVTSLTAGMPSGWKQSAFPPSLIGRDARDKARCWSVEIPSTAILDGRVGIKGGQGFVAQPYEVRDTIIVRWTHVIKDVASYTLALEVDATITKALYVGTSAIVCTGMTSPILAQSDREITSDGSMAMGSMTFSVTRLFGLPA